MREEAARLAGELPSKAVDLRRKQNDLRTLSQASERARRGLSWTSVATSFCMQQKKAQDCPLSLLWPLCRSCHHSVYSTFRSDHGSAQVSEKVTVQLSLTCQNLWQDNLGLSVKCRPSEDSLLESQKCPFWTSMTSSWDGEAVLSRSGWAAGGLLRSKQSSQLT